MSTTMVYTQFTRELDEYLRAKLPDIPVAIVQEIAAHIGNKTALLVLDMIREHDRETGLMMRLSRRTSEERRQENMQGGVTNG